MNNPHQGARLIVYSREQTVVRLQAGVRAVEVVAAFGVSLRVTGTRVGCLNRGAGWDFVHVVVDDATRLAYVEVLGDERRDTTTALMLRALRWFRAHGIRAERVMSDNGSAYRSRRFAKALRLLGIRHTFTRPYTPKTNGKAERFIQTLLRQWA